MLRERYLGEHLNGTVGHTETGASAVLGSPQVEQLAYPNALGESDPWVFNGDIENLSRLVEQGISSSDTERIPRYNVV
ncbi:MAG TPA: transposase [Cyanothece sp. UBA12306]|nr:transposase [Cyanothece sp. UBA12306]